MIFRFLDHQSHGQPSVVSEAAVAAAAAFRLHQQEQAALCTIIRQHSITVLQHKKRTLHQEVLRQKVTTINIFLVTRTVLLKIDIMTAIMFVNGTHSPTHWFLQMQWSASTIHHLPHYLALFFSCFHLFFVVNRRNNSIQTLTLLVKNYIHTDTLLGNAQIWFTVSRGQFRASIASVTVCTLHFKHLDLYFWWQT